MFQKVTQGIIAGALLVLALVAAYFAIDYTRAKRAVGDAIDEANEERQLNEERERIEESRTRRGANRERDEYGRR